MKAALSTLQSRRAAGRDRPAAPGSLHTSCKREGAFKASPDLFICKALVSRGGKTMQEARSSTDKAWDQKSSRWGASLQGQAGALVC